MLIDRQNPVVEKAAPTVRRVMLAAALLVTTALAVPGHADDYDQAFRFTVPTEPERDTSGTSQLLATGLMATRAVNAPSGVCPGSGTPTDADFQDWFKLWSLENVTVYLMSSNPASYRPLLEPKPVISNGATRTFFVGAAPVKQVAMCVYRISGNFDADDVEVTLLRRGLTDGACAPAANPPCELTKAILPTLNSLFILERTNDLAVEYVISVTAPPQGSVGVHIGGRLSASPIIEVSN